MSNKKIIKKGLLVGIILVMFLSSIGYTNQKDIRVIVNEDYVNFEVQPIIENGRTLVGVRKIFEQMGASVLWDDEDRVVTLIKDGDKLQIPIGRNEVTVKGKITKIKVPAKIKDGRTLIPLRFVSENLGYNVVWESNTKTIFIDDPDLVSSESAFQYQPEYILDNNVKYKGEVNGKKQPHGYGAVYYLNSNQVKYKGFWKNGEYDGQGSMYEKDGSIYIKGYFENGELKKTIKTQEDSYGTYEYGNGNLFIGSLLNSKPNGYGSLYRANRNLISDNYLAENQSQEQRYDESNLTFKTKYNNNNEKIYEGYIDSTGLKQKEGTEYYENGIKKYKGEFKNGLYHGEGKLYSSKGEIIYEGDFERGLKNGYGIEQYVNGEVKYKGEFKHGLYNGVGTMFNEMGENGNTGKWENGNFLHAVDTIKPGTNEIYDKNGALVYVGDINTRTNKKDGQGVEYYENGSVKYKGEYKNDRFYGNGQLFYKTGELQYSGEFVNANYHGYGKEYDEKGILIYEGEFVSGDYDGNGKLYNEDLLAYEGEFENSQYNGEGTKYSGEVVEYHGTFKQGNYSGDGKLYNKNGDLIYNGEFSRGLYSGYGELYDENTATLIYKGQFSNGNYNGFGKLFDEDTGEILKSGNFVNNEFETGIIETDYTLQIFENEVTYQYQGEDVLTTPEHISKETKYLYEGKMVNNIPNRNGVLYIEENNIRKIVYDGEFSNGLLNGNGKLYFNNELFYDGEFKDNLYHGNGSIYIEDDKITAEFRNGELVD